MLDLPKSMYDDQYNEITEDLLVDLPNFSTPYIILP